MFSRWPRLAQLAQRYNLGPLFSEIKEKAGVILQAGCIVYVFREYCMEVSVVSLCSESLLGDPKVILRRCWQSEVCFMQCMGPSMLPTFNTRGDVLLLEHLSTHFGRIGVGEPVHDSVGLPLLLKPVRDCRGSSLCLCLSCCWLCGRPKVARTENKADLCSTRQASCVTGASFL